jgi:hypothetical protein
MRFFLGKRFRFPVVGSLYAGVSVPVHVFPDKQSRAAFWFGVLLAGLILFLWGTHAH